MLRPSVLASIGFVAAAAAAVLALSLDSDEPSEVPPPPVAGAATLAGRATIDVVRVGDGGDAMIAGRAAPKGEVVLVADGRDLGRAVADANGEWVFVPSLPFSPGAWLLGVTGGGGTTTTDAAVVLVVPDADPGGAFAFRTAPGQASKMVLAPAGGLGNGPAFTVVDQDRDGRLFVSGHAEADGLLHLYMDNRLVGRVRADSAGSWLLAAMGPGRGTHTLRVDQLDHKGRVTARAEQHWRSDEDLAATDGAPVPVRAVKDEGGVWRVVCRRDAGGVSYATVYPGGKGQLRDPETLYPGQAAGATPP